jgi:hypothetical protein
MKAICFAARSPLDHRPGSLGMRMCVKRPKAAFAAEPSKYWRFELADVNRQWRAARSLATLGLRFAEIEQNSIPLRNAAALWAFRSRGGQYVFALGCDLFNRRLFCTGPHLTAASWEIRICEMRRSWLQLFSWG